MDQFHARTRPLGAFLVTSYEHGATLPPHHRKDRYADHLRTHRSHCSRCLHYSLANGLLHLWGYPRLFVLAPPHRDLYIVYNIDLDDE